MEQNIAFNIFNDVDNGCDNNNNPPLPSIWIFGYGSLCYNPGFEYDKCVTGYVRGYLRRFWQGNVTHRGTIEKPGRVATLVESKEGIVFGCAYKITGDLALNYLEQRECTLGGYITTYTKFYPRFATESSGLSGEAFPALMYIATSKSPYWAGEESLEQIAEKIASSRGPSGHNVEYLIKLAIFMRETMPGVNDDHLFDLERLVREHLIKRDIDIQHVMGLPTEIIRRDSHENLRRAVTFEYTSRVAEKKLRCLNI